MSNSAKFSASLAIWISRFLTENGFYSDWKEETSVFAHEQWAGRRHNRVSENRLRNILASFCSPQRDSFFTLFYKSDYKLTYFGRNLLPSSDSIYLKHYLVDQAPFKIRIRNLLRRSLARKGFNLYFSLQKKGVASICPLFYLHRKPGFIPAQALFGSIASNSNQTVRSLLNRELPAEELIDLAADLGRYVGALHARGILFGELYRNILVSSRNDGWEFVLCDLDEMRSLSGMRERDRLKYLQDLRRKLRAKGELVLAQFDRAYESAFGSARGAFAARKNV